MGQRAGAQILRAEARKPWSQAYLRELPYAWCVDSHDDPSPSSALEGV